MRSQSQSEKVRRGVAILIEAGGYIAALFLPWLGTGLSLRTHALQTTPLALGFVAIAGITVYSGFRPGLAAVLSNTLAFNYYLIPPPGTWSLSGSTIFYSCIIFCIGLLIATMCERQNAIKNRLRSALSSLQMQRDALMEAQQGSHSAAWTYKIAEERIQWAEGGTEIFGRPFAGLTTRDLLLSLVVEEDRVQLEASIEAGTGTTFHAEFRVRWPNGEIHWLETRGRPSPVDASIWHGVTIDVTDRKSAELALIRAEKLAAIGRLSATIAHEINNPLEVVTNLLYLALKDDALAPETRRYLDLADQQLARLASIARHTLTFVRPGSAKGPTKVEAIAESVVAMFQPRCRELRLLGTSDAYVAVPPGDLRQILTNLVSNACDALIGAEGVIEIEISVEGDLAAVEVRDNGSGILPENLGRIFDAFFTTKEGVGTGIGLWVTKELVEKNGGQISVHTGDGRGTVFRVELPLMETGKPTSVQQL